MELRKLPGTEFHVPPVCVGTSALGSFPEQYGYTVDERSAIDTLVEAIATGFTFIDTSNEYGGGASEERVGRALKQYGNLPNELLVATKVDPLPGSTDFSGARVRASILESQERLGIDVLPLVYLHDPEKITWDEANRAGGPVEALVQLREEGVIQHLGVAAGPIDLELDYFGLGVFDVVLSHNRFTLLNDSASPLMDEVKRSSRGFVNAAPFGGGMLSRGPHEVSSYMYSEASEGVTQRAIRIQDICDSFNVPLAALALQFSVRDSRVASTVVGMSQPKRVKQTLDLLEWSIPSDLWDQVDSLELAY